MKSALLLALVAVLFPLAAPAQILIDRFDDAGIATAPSGIVGITNIVAGAMLGGERLMQSSWISGNDSSTTEVDRLGNGDYEFTTGPGTIGQSFVRYDGVGTPGPGLGIDVSQGGVLDAIRMRVLLIDTHTKVTVSIQDSSGNIAVGVKTIPSTLPTPTGVNFRFEDMTGGPGPIDLTDIDVITFQVEPQAAESEFRVEVVGIVDLAVVPAPALGPAGLALLVVALSGVAAATITRRRSA